MSEAVRYPVDFDAVDKGSVIDADTLESILGVPRTSSLYSGKQTEFCALVERELEARNRFVLVRCSKADIRILTDAEAAEEANHLFHSYRKRMARMHRKTMEVDTVNLDEEQRRKHAISMVKQGAILAGMNAGRKAIQPVIHERKTPGLPNPAE